MDIIVLVLAVLGAFLLGVGADRVLIWLVKREALSLVNKRNNQASQEKKQAVNDEKGILIGELAAILREEGNDQKEKLNKALAVIVAHPEAADALINKFRRFL